MSHHCRLRLRLVSKNNHPQSSPTHCRNLEESPEVRRSAAERATGQSGESSVSDMSSHSVAKPSVKKTSFSCALAFLSSSSSLSMSLGLGFRLFATALKIR